jgi:N-acetylglucosamine-6-sulfatase
VPPDPANFNEADVSDKPAWIRALSPLSQQTIDAWRTERVASQRALLGVDDGIQEIVRTLKAKGQLANTMIILMADHGFSWGSHRWIKKHCVYEECSKFPPLIRHPGLSGNRRESRLVSNVDLASTISKFTGTTPGLPQDGRSLLPVLTNTVTAWKQRVLMEAHVGTNRSCDGIRVPGWTYAEYSNGHKELYDLTADPAQLQNRANQAAYQTKQAELAKRLQALRGT